MKMKNRTFLFVLLATFAGGTLRAQVPQLINYQGRVAVNAANFQGAGQFKFALVNSAGSTTFWSNDGTSAAGSEPAAAVTLTVDKGLYSVLLGDTLLGNMTAIPVIVFANPDVRLRVWFNDGVNGSQLLTPDQRLAPSGYLSDGAVTTASIADGAVTTAKIAAGAVTGTSIAPASIGGANIAAGSLDFSHLTVPAPPTAGQVLGFNGTSLNWSAPGAGDGIWTLNGTTATYGNGVRIGDILTWTDLTTGFPPSAITNANGTLYFRMPQGGNVVTAAYVDASGMTVRGRTAFQTGGSGGEVSIGTPSGESGLSIGNTGGARADLRFDGSTFKMLAGPAGGPPGVDRGINVTTAGNVGVGIAPQAKLHMYDAVNSISHRIQTNGGANAFARVEFTNQNGQWDIGSSRGFNGDQFYIYREGSAGIAFAVQPNGDATLQGTMSCKVLTIRGGADLAEPFAMSHRGIPAGAVVSIDPRQPGKLKMSGNAYDKKVAGIVSGANGIKPGISMIDEEQLEPGENVALSGRVYVKANISAGPIQPGDLLTTSDVPGEAMKAADHDRAQGSILGKAMTPLDAAAGEVLVLVTLQ